MVKKPCMICGKETSRVSLKGSKIETHICSRKCEYEYFDTLYGKDKALQEVLLYLDRRIAKIRRYELCCWLIALFGVVIVILSIFLSNISTIESQLIGPFLFVAGAAPVAGSLLLTSQFGKEKQELVDKRKQLSLAYSY
jgi:hypothetical protein